MVTTVLRKNQSYLKINRHSEKAREGKKEQTNLTFGSSEAPLGFAGSTF